MVLILKNITGINRSYLSGTVLVNANSTTTITGGINQFNVAVDAGIRSDIAQQILLVNNGFLDLPTTDAVAYLDFIVNLTKTITGGTDSTIIGNVGDRLKVDANITSIGGGTPTLSKKTRYDDMNAANNGVARATTIVLNAAATTLYSYTGSGIFLGFMLNLESSSSSSQNWKINVLVDGEEIFNSEGLNSQDLISTSVYDFNSAGSREPPTLGIEMTGSSIYVSTSNYYPITYASSVVIKVKITAGGNKKFNAGLALLTKDS